LSEALHNKASF